MSLARALMSVANSRAKYWRIRIDETVGTTSETVQIYEIEFRATAGGSDETSAADAAARATAISESSASRSPDNAFNDDGTSSYWESGTVTQPGTWWIQWEFATGIIIDEVTIAVVNSVGADTPAAVTIQSSNDGTNFTDEFSDASLSYDGSDIATITRS